MRANPQIAGLLNPEKTALSNTLEELFGDVTIADNLFTGNTTLGIVVTNAKLNKTQLTKVAGMTTTLCPGHPAGPHQRRRGQHLRRFCRRHTGRPGSDRNTGSRSCKRAVIRAVESAVSAYGYPGLGKLS